MNSPLHLRGAQTTMNVNCVDWKEYLSFVVGLCAVCLGKKVCNSSVILYVGASVCGVNRGHVNPLSEQKGTISPGLLEGVLNWQTCGKLVGGVPSKLSCKEKRDKGLSSKYTK